MAAVTFFGSSHACENHNFPQFFYPLFRGSDIFDYWAVEVIGVPGRKMDNQAVRDILNCARSIAPRKHYLVVNLGTNNFRRRNWKLGDYPEDLIGFYKDIADAMESIPNCVLVIPSLIPDFGRDDILKDEYRRFTAHAKALASVKNNVNFCNFVKNLCVNNRLDPTCYWDDVHLSERGARIYAESIYNYLEHNCSRP